MIHFNNENDFQLPAPQEYERWINQIILSEKHRLGEINYVFCDDEFLLKINQEYLSHDTYTDIITFDYKVGRELFSDIYISTDRVKENAEKFGVSFENELKRVMAHGILHLCGYSDATDAEKRIMREKENEKIDMFHVEH
ncbi:rRNA maturation RNase YbeY [Mesonia sp. HuA40]|uniref:rRNA maturation RNase YbeY n=1 Tax=Mesonia sp. HuA40 TaxID=2602761 RepID=UPI0011C8D075|nr:rRNA maturation RNase YbeY [Mesonia sp. HuA40]TXK72576.1 rRNA maturation RNase YbeY [Mesonia sp. HuA40]